MRSVTVRLDDLRNLILNLGFVGENEHRQFRFDSMKMFGEYPNASVSMTVCPPEGDAYPATIERDGDFVIWTITDSDLVAEGDGEIQITFTESPHIAKTYIGRTKTSRSLVPTGDIPSGLDDFITRADALLDQVEEAFPTGGTTGQVLAKKSNADYDTEWVDQGGGGGTSDYEELDNLPQIGGVTLKGNKTLHDLGAAAESDIPDVSGFYTKPADGIPAADIASGVIPVLTDLIDDTAGDGDTNKVWSADKSSELLNKITNTENIVNGTIQKYYPVNFYDGTYNAGYYNNTSVTGESGTLVRSKPIWLDAGDYLFIGTAGQYGANNGNAVFYVDSTGACSERVAGTSVGTATEEGVYSSRQVNKFTLSQARYVAFNVGYISKSTATVEQISNFMVCHGSVIADWPHYTPYSDPYYNLKPTCPLTAKMESQINGTSGLVGKTAIFDGDSICNGTSVGYDDPTYGQGWAGRIGIANSMSYKNFGISGGVIVSADNATADGRHSVVDNVDTMYSEFPDADYIVFEGGVNDADLQITMGSYDAYDFAGTYDDETFTGALETIFYKATNYWKGKQIGFIIAQKMGTANSVMKNRSIYFERVREVCRKWGIPFVDLWNECYLDGRNPNLYNSSLTDAENIAQGYLYIDGQHLTAKGYDYITPIIENWMKGMVNAQEGGSIVEYIPGATNATTYIYPIAGHRYVCGEVSSLSITPATLGCVDVIFESGSTPTVLTVPNDVKWANGFDPTSLEANTTYEINILDGVYGVVVSWT